MAAELLTDASRATDSNSNPYAGAQWFFYASGTLTPQNVYANADLSTSLGAVVTADAAGRFVPIYFDGLLVYRGILKDASGTTLPGMDIDPINTGLSSILGAPGGSSAVGFLQAGAGAASRTMQDKGREMVTPADFTGGLVSALSAVRNNDDTSFSGTVSVPNGIIARGTTQVMPQIHARVQGTGGGTFFMQAAVPAFSWSGVASAAQSDFQGFRVYGGTHAFDITPSGEVASLHFTDVSSTSITGVGWKISGGLTSCVFTRCSQLGGTFGIDSAGGINNHNVLDHVTFGNLSDSAIRSKGLTQGLELRNVRVEGGGTDGKIVYDFEGAYGVRLISGWYEAHHQYLLKLDATSIDGTVIDGIVDAGASHSGGALKGSLFDVGEKLIEFRTNAWFQPTVAPKNILWTGINDRLYAASSNVWEHKSQRGGKVHLRQRNTAVDTSTFDVLTFTRSVATPDLLTNLQALSGVLTLTFSGLNSASGLPTGRTEKFAISVTGVGASFNMGLGSSFAAVNSGGGTVTFSVSEKAGGTSTSKTLRVTVAGNFAGQDLIEASFEFDNNSNIATNLITVAAL